jgi:hypothetical protein
MVWVINLITTESSHDDRKQNGDRDFTGDKKCSSAQNYELKETHKEAHLDSPGRSSGRGYPG